MLLATDSSPSDIEQISVTIVGCSVAETCTLPAAPTVDFVVGTNDLGPGDPITDADGSVNITGTWTSILWTQPEYSTDGVTFLPAPGTGTFGDLTFSDPTVQVPTVSEDAGGGSGQWYKVVITVTGPGGTVFDEEIIKFEGF